MKPFFFGWLAESMGSSTKYSTNNCRNRRGAHVRIAHRGNVVDCWPGANDATHHVTAGTWYDGVSLNGVRRVIENRPNENDAQRRRK